MAEPDAKDRYEIVAVSSLSKRGGESSLFNVVRERRQDMMERGRAYNDNKLTKGLPEKLRFHSAHPFMSRRVI